MSTEHQTYTCEQPLTDAEIAEWKANGWELFSVIGAISTEDRRRSYHFRRVAKVIEPSGRAGREHLDGVGKVFEPSGPKRRSTT